MTMKKIILQKLNKYQMTCDSSNKTKVKVGRTCFTLEQKLVRGTQKFSQQMEFLRILDAQLETGYKMRIYFLAKGKFSE